MPLRRKSLAAQPLWCTCKRLRNDRYEEGIHLRCGLPTQGGDGPTPIDLRQALRNDGRTGVGTVGDGIGEAGDPSPTLSTSGATPAVFVKAARASHAWNVDKGTVESWKDSGVAPTLNVNDNTGDTRATAVVLDAEPLAVDGRSGRSSTKTNTLTADMDSARVANRRSGTVLAGTTEVAACGCCPVDPKPDSARYRACGNAVTVPVISWIGARALTAGFDLS